MRNLAAFIASVLWFLSASGGVAQTPGKREATGYTEAIREALSEFELGHFPESLENFRRAHAIDPNGRTYRGLGVVEFELRHYRAAVKLLEQALAETRKPLTGKLRAETETALERARAYVGAVRLETEPAHATVVVDGEAVDRRSSDTVQLDVGDHVFEFQADGYLATRRNVSVKGGENEPVRVVLASLAEPELAPQAPERSRELTAPPPPAAERDEPLYTKWWLWTAVGVVVAAGATTGVLLLTQDAEQHRGPTLTSNTPAGGTIQTLTWTGR